MVVRIIALIIIFFFLIMIICAVIAVFKPELIKMLIKSGDMDQGNKERKGEKHYGNVMDFLPFEKISRHFIELGNYRYRCIVEASSLNYWLMTDIEQEMAEASFRSFLDSLDFPIEIYVQTREFDTEEMLSDLEKRIEASCVKNPALIGYGEMYLSEMSEITKRFGNSKVKKKYIIIPFDEEDMGDMSELTGDELEEFAKEELLQRASVVIGGLRGVGLSAELLSETEISEVIYSYLHRNSFRIADDIVSGNLTSLTIDGPEERRDKRYLLDKVLSKTQSEVKSLVTQDSTDEDIKIYKYIYRELGRLKQDDKDKEMAQLFYDTARAAEREGYLEDYIHYMKKNPETDISTVNILEERRDVLTLPGEKDILADTKWGEIASEKEIPVGEFDPELLRRKKKRGKRDE